MYPYTTIANLRAEGVPDPPVTDATLTARILRVSQMIDMWTGHHFDPVAKTIIIDGNGGHTLHVDEPICEVTAIRVLFGDPLDLDFQEITIDDVLVFNRHLTQNLTNPDDRQNPKLAFRRDFDSGPFALGHWPDGNQNIEITGTFGFTEYDGVEAHGITPLLITHLANLMVIRELPGLYDSEARDDAGALRGRVSKYKTRDQEIQIATVGASAAGGALLGAFTGDPEIDNLIAHFKRAPGMGAA